MKTDNPVNIWKEMIHEYSLMNARVKELAHKSYSENHLQTSKA